MFFLIDGRALWFLTLVMAFISFEFLYRQGKKGISYQINRNPAIDAIDETIGRCAETGTPLLTSPGSFALQSQYTASMIVGIDMVGYITGKCVEKGVKPLIGVYAADTMAAVTEVYKNACLLANKPEEFKEENIKFLGAGGYNPGMMGLLEREKCGGVLLVGNYWSQALYIGMTARRTGAISVAGSQDFDMASLGFASNDYFMLADELYAAGAYVSKSLEIKNSVVSHDVMKWYVFLLIILGVIASGLSSDAILNLLKL